MPWFLKDGSPYNKDKTWERVERVSIRHRPRPIHCFHVDKGRQFAPGDVFAFTAFGNVANGKTLASLATLARLGPGVFVECQGAKKKNNVWPAL